RSLGRNRMRTQWPEYLSGPSVPGREGRYTTLTETNCWFANRPAVARDFYSRLTPAQTGSDRRDASGTKTCIHGYLKRGTLFFREIAELMFGFWTSLAGTDYAQTLWDRCLHKAFRTT